MKIEFNGDSVTVVGTVARIVKNPGTGCTYVYLDDGPQAMAVVRYLGEPPPVKVGEQHEAVGYINAGETVRHKGLWLDQLPAPPSNTTTGRTAEEDKPKTKRSRRGGKGGNA